MESSALALRVIRQTDRPVWRPEFALVVGLWVPDQTGLNGGAGRRTIPILAGFAVAMVVIAAGLR